MGVRLPSEYQEVEYIESTGTQYIRTDVYPSNNIGFDVTFYTNSELALSGNFGCIFGGRRSTNDNDFQLTTYQPGTSMGGVFRSGNTAGQKSAGIIPQTIQSASYHNNIFTNAAGNIIQTATYEWNNIYPIFLFLLNNNGSPTQGGAGCRIYVMRFYNDDDLVRDYVPCYRKSDFKPGMYDLVSGTFFTNQGTGEFLVGPDVIDSISPWLFARRRLLMKKKTARLPAEYQEVEYLETSQTGAPYINSGVAITEDLVFEIDFQLPNVVKARYFMGAYYGTDFYLYTSGDATPYFQTAFGANWHNTTLLADTQRHKFTYQFENGNLVVKENDTIILTKVKGAFSTRHILVGGTSESVRIPCKTYESKMTKSGVVIQDLIPCYRKADDTPGMYDLVSNTFFTNAGTGEFIVGADIN